MNKFDRVISTLVLLQTRKIIKAVSISERFGVSLRTVYRDISTLKNAGIPIIGDPGIGYSIVEGYRLPPLMFNEGEASAMLTAEKFVGKMKDEETQKYYSSAWLKIKAILRSSEKQSLSILDESIAISDQNSWENKTYLQDLFRSIAAKNVLNIEYQKVNSSSSERKIEPIGCYHQFNNWYLVAYCQFQKDYRTFKVNRIVNLQVLDECFDSSHVSLSEYVNNKDESWKEEQTFHNIEIAFKQEFVEFAEKRKYYFGFVEQNSKNDLVIMKFLNSDLELVARWLLQFGAQASVYAPAALKNRMNELSSQLFKHYK